MTATLRRAEFQAHRLRHSAVRSEHLLLALSADRAVADLLERVGVTVEDLRGAVWAGMIRGARPVLDDELPWAEDARDVLITAVEEAQGLGHAELLPGHLLLGMVNAASGDGVRVLEQLGVDLDRLRLEMLEAFAQADADADA